MRSLRTGIKMLSMMVALSFGVIGCTVPLQPREVEVKDYTTSDVNSEEKQEEESIILDWEEALENAQKYLEEMTLEEKVGQLFIVNLEQLDHRKGNYYEFRKANKKMKEALERYHVGGVILFSRNINKPKQITKLTTDLQEASKIPLFITVDEEGGDVARIASNPKMKTTVFPSAEEIGKTQNSEYVYDMGKTIGTEIGNYGFNVNFAPVADVRTSELNEEIGNRSFGDDPENVSEFVSAFVQGLGKVNICSTLKHFPGQGSSEGDTHEESVDIDSGIATLRKTDFLPFKTGISAGADFIMVSHISVSKVTESSIPASMSDLMMQTILREELGFEKIIITDAFDMASVTDYYSTGVAAFKAIKAGADVVLEPENLSEAYAEIMTKVEEGVITEQRLDESVSRIIAVKLMHGIMNK